MKLIFLGAPGSGKGTQGARLSAQLRIPHISTGEMLREAVAAGSTLGREVASLIDCGKLVPDNLALALVRKALDRLDAAAGFILDGFPRTVPQAQDLDRLLNSRSLSLDAVIELRIEEAALFNRIRGRTRESEARGDAARKDDNAEVLKIRLDAYHLRTSPLVDYYAERGLVKVVDGSKSVDAVYDEIRARLAANLKQL